ncbi:hypothetical protein GCM10010112_82580 [Actinoplanes lobatus]|uniref:LysM domain-containing protein n=2 Tax=Actinoplanes lobatus TaxID=113568 RepID=A0ABQ4AV42_9ACTN|nr:hypothetical protein GCM10010112_82580 [Actinoplanes lobatus]GIE44853.1 hypothetical protein Alo02nite_77510 [Actinoplanes lobatus]
MWAVDTRAMSDDMHRRTAELARQPSVWVAAPPPPGRPPAGRRAFAAGRALLGSLVLLVVPPAVLWLVFGNPVDRIPSGATVSGFLAGDDGDRTRILLFVVVAVLWLVWAVMAVLLAGSLLTVIAGWRMPRWRLPAPVHRMLFGLAGTAVVAVGATGIPSAAAESPEVPVASGTTALQQGTVTVLVGDEHYEYQVKRGDTLSKIARRWLGDADRWPEICRLNRHEHVAAGARLTDCDLIIPGWRLRLPEDARPPGASKPRTPPAATPPSAPGTATPVPSAPATATPPPPQATSAPSSSQATSAPSSPSAAAAPPAREAPPVDAEPVAPAADQDGIRLPSGSIVPWSLAAAISAAATLAWRQRRRRFRPTADTAHVLPAQPLPEPVTAIHRHTLRHPAEPLTARWPYGGLGVNGPGAADAVRGLIITALTDGSPDEPGHRTHVIIDRTTCDDLLGPGVTGWDRLRVTADVTASLDLLDAHLLQRRRLLNDHGIDTIDDLHAQAPAEEALPPLLLIGRAADAATARAAVVLGLAAGLDATAVLIGSWPPGITCTITTDGRTSTPGDQPAQVPATVAVLAQDDAITILDTVRESHTSTPPPATQPVVQQTVSPPTAANPVRLCVLGQPRIEDMNLPGRNVRGKAFELAVFLACHPHGADTDTIAENLLPDVRRKQAYQQVHTNASNLRHGLGRAGGPNPGGYLLKRGTAARYRLDPDTVAVDLWQLRDLLGRARIASGPARADLLRAACDLYTAPLADGCDYDWITAHRENAHRFGLEAHLLLAEDLLPTDPRSASDLLDKAIGLDRYNEELYRAAMRARHALGDTGGVKQLLRAVTRALADLDAEPEDATTDLAARLGSR